ncbi:MAG: vanadium-dependent haloperoxidase [Cytophagales bacterium]|nr:vanadium-dependent haloperoxidase [Rhizobacter sp.]
MNFSNGKAALMAGCLIVFTLNARADVVTDWNLKAGELIVDAKLGTPPANRVMALVQTAVYEAVRAAALRQPGDAAALDAAVAAANRSTLLKLMPTQEPAISAAYQAALAKLPEGAAKTAGITAGEQAAAAVLARRADDGAATPERYRPHTTPGIYVPTAAMAAPQWPQRKPWLMASASQFRPGPPPALTSAQWARDYEEVKTLGAKAGSKRSAEQTEVARFWEFSLPPIYHAVLRSVATQPGRSVAQNARFYATATQAMDDAMIAVFDAKYHYNFWRPITAIRNGDADGNNATQPEAAWASLIDPPLHPEYPSAHSILAGTLGVVLQAEAGAGALPVLSASSPSAQGATRRWRQVDDFTQEVANSRIWAGIHYRTSGEVGLAMGQKIGALAVAQMATVPIAEAQLVERVAVRGVQVYECRADAGAAGGVSEVFVAPHAELFAPQARAIPWLLLTGANGG